MPRSANLDLANDWTMRAAGNLEGVTFTLWRLGLLAALPACVNQPIVRPLGAGKGASGQIRAA